MVRKKLVPRKGPPINLRPAGVHKDQRKKKQEELKPLQCMYYDDPQDVNQGWWK